MTKDELRKLYREKRKTYTPEYATEAGEKIRDIFMRKIDLSKAHLLHTFLPIRHSNEIDTWPLIDRFWDVYTALKIVVPVTDFNTHHMIACALHPKAKLTENKMHIPEPVIHEIVDEHKIDVVITPLMVADYNGYRVGYGKGFYDKFFESCRPDVFKIGVSYDPPVEQIDDIEPHDVPLDACVWPGGIVWF